MFKIRKKSNLNKKSTEFIELYASRISTLDNIGIKTELKNWINETKLLIKNNESVIGLENFLDNIYEFDFPLHLDEMNLLRELIKDFKLKDWLGEYYSEVPILTSSGILNRQDYELNESQEIRIYGEIINFNSIEELTMKFDCIEWNLRKISFDEFSAYNKWCELEFLPNGRVFSGFVEKRKKKTLVELFCKFRYEVEFEEENT